MCSGLPDPAFRSSILCPSHQWRRPRQLERRGTGRDSGLRQSGENTLRRGRRRPLAWWRGILHDHRRCRSAGAGPAGGRPVDHTSAAVMGLLPPVSAAHWRSGSPGNGAPHRLALHQARNRPLGRDRHQCDQPADRGSHHRGAPGGQCIVPRLTAHPSPPMPRPHHGRVSCSGLSILSPAITWKRHLRSRRARVAIKRTCNGVSIGR